MLILLFLYALGSFKISNKLDFEKLLIRSESTSIFSPVDKLVKKTSVKLESIFGRGAQWTPFSIQSAKNTLSQYKSFLSGNQDFYDAIIKTSAATKTTAPIWEFVKLNTIGTKIGQYSSGSSGGGGATSKW